jgi:hypothetical protein
VTFATSDPGVGSVGTAEYAWTAYLWGSSALEQRVRHG